MSTMDIEVLSGICRSPFFKEHIPTFVIICGLLVRMQSDIDQLYHLTSQWPR